MKKILNIARTFAAMLFVLIAGGAVFMIATGRMKVERLPELLGPEPGEVKEGEKQAEPLTPAESEEIARKNLMLNEELRQRRRDFPMEVSRYATHLEMLKGEVDDRMAELEKERAAFASEKQRLEEFKKTFEEKVRDKGFKKSLEILQKMDAAAAAATIRNWDDEEILRYFQQMKASVLTEIITELNKYPARATEGQRGAELLNKLDEFTFHQGTGTVSN